MCDLSLQPILALFGPPVAGNPTQYMVEKAFARHGMDWRYLSLAIEADDLADAVRGMKVMGFRGGNCTRLHKQAIIEHLDSLGPIAELAQAVNCVFREKGGLVGENTEGKAFIKSLARVGNPAGKRVVLLGAGCVARAIGVELAASKVAEVIVVNRSVEAGEDLATLLRERLETPSSFSVWTDPYPLPEGIDILVHATSLGDGDPQRPLPIDLDGLKEPTVVHDVTESPRTWLLDRAAGLGLKTVDGLQMAIDQVAINFELWTGVEPDADVLREAAEEFLEW